MTIARVFYQRDIYNCSSCSGWVGRGDSYCKHCGFKFSSNDVKEMIAAATFLRKWNAPFHSTFDETYECIACSGLVSIENTFCKHCGRNFSSEDREEMKGANNPNKIHGYVIGIPFFIGTAIALTIIFLFLGVK